MGALQAQYVEWHLSRLYALMVLSSPLLAVL